MENDIEPGYWTKKQVETFIQKFNDGDLIAKGQVKNNVLYLNMVFTTFDFDDVESRN